MTKKVVALIFFISIITIFCNANDPVTYWNTATLNTGANAHYLSKMEKEVIIEINKLRSNPAEYAKEYIEPLKKYYKGKLLHYPGDLPLKTKEGAKALVECVNFLKKQKPVSILHPKKGLSDAANDHVKDQSYRGGTGHIGSDHSGIKERIERYGKWHVRIAENITYGKINAQQIVVYLLIDDGIYSRGHRKNFLNSEFKEIGVASGSHPYYENMCVMNFAGSFQNHE